MPTCHNCGEIVMNGDPYCPNCGTTFKWGFDDVEDNCGADKRDKAQIAREIFDQMLESDLTSREKFDLFRKHLFLSDYMLDEIMESIIREEKLYNCKFIMVYTLTYPQVYIFLRQDKYRDVIILERCYIDCLPTMFDIDATEFHYVYGKLLNNPKFKSEVERIEKKGLKFKEVYSNITVPIWENDLSAIFTDGDKRIFYEIDDELNLKKLF